MYLSKEKFRGIVVKSVLRELSLNDGSFAKLSQLLESNKEIISELLACEVSTLDDLFVQVADKIVKQGGLSLPHDGFVHKLLTMSTISQERLVDFIWSILQRHGNADLMTEIQLLTSRVIDLGIFSKSDYPDFPSFIKDEIIPIAKDKFGLDYEVISARCPDCDFPFVIDMKRLS